MAVGLYDYDAAQRLAASRDRVELDVEGHRTAVDELVGVRVPDLVLLNDGDLAYTKIRLDPRSLATVTDSLGTLDDSLARGLCWSAAWDMIRDAELPARRYLDLVLANLGGEDQIAVVAGLLRNAEAAAVVFGDPANREPARRRLAEHALDGAAGRGRRAATCSWPTPGPSPPPPGATTTSRSSRALLDDGPIEGVDGLAVDTELRWALVRSLATAGVDDAPALIAAEEERDATDAGARHAAAARAAQPHEAPKAEPGRPWSTATCRWPPCGRSWAGSASPTRSRVLQAWTTPYFDALLPDLGAAGPRRRDVLHRDALPGRRRRGAP